MFDINNLQGEYKTGNRVDQPGSESILLMTPVARLSFPELVTATHYQNNPKNAARFGCTLVFETDPSKPGAVDLNSTFFPAFAEASQRLKAPLQQSAEGVRFGGDKNHLILFGEKYNQASGQPYDGYSPTSVSITAYRYPSTKNPRVPCYGPDGQLIEPTALLPGYWVRVVLNPYRPKTQTTPMISCGLVSVQLVAEGETFGQDADYAFGSIPGAPPIGMAAQVTQNTEIAQPMPAQPMPAQPMPAQPMFDLTRFQKTE